jgi:hypothetical protein
VTGTDTDTGVYYPAANQVALATNGTQALIVDSSQNVGIGTASPSNKLTVKTADGAGIAIQNAAGTEYRWAVNLDNSFSAVNTGVAERLRINTTGNLVLQGGTVAASGTGVTFPATQSASNDANCLDDYEEGTWTPTVTGVSTYTVQNGIYTKIGKFVLLVGEIAGTDSGTLSSFDIGSFPFVLQGTTTVYPVGGFFPVAGFTSNATSILLQGSPSQNGGRVYWISNGTTNYNNVTSGDIASTFNCEFSISFIAVN